MNTPVPLRTFTVTSTPNGRSHTFKTGLNGVLSKRTYHGMDFPTAYDHWVHYLGWDKYSELTAKKGD